MLMLLLYSTLTAAYAVCRSIPNSTSKHLYVELVTSRQTVGVNVVSARTLYLLLS